MHAVNRIVWLGLFGLWSSLAGAQTDVFPSRPIRMIVGFPAGGASDVAARTISGRMAELLGNPIADRVRELSLALYQRGAQLAAERGILLADTKFEFGLDADGQLLLIDEALTPDSSRYWLADRWAPGQNPPSLDKQFLRDYLETIPGWDKQPPAPHLPEAVIEGIRARYLDLAGRFGVQL